MKKKIPNFKAPDGYFEDFMGRLKDRMEEKSPIIPEDDGFTVPDGYFENFGERLNEVIPPSLAKSKLIKLQPWMFAAAASVALLVFIPWGSSSEEQLDFTDLAFADLEAYWEEADVELTALEINNWTEEDLELLSMDSAELESEELLEYLEMELEPEEQENLYNNDLILESDEEN